jgi:hypothetical protein
LHACRCAHIWAAHVSRNASLLPCLQNASAALSSERPLQSEAEIAAIVQAARRRAESQQQQAKVGGVVWRGAGGALRASCHTSCLPACTLATRLHPHHHPPPSPASQHEGGSSGSGMGEASGLSGLGELCMEDQLMMMDDALMD